MKNIKRIMAVILTVVMIFASVPLSVFATDTEYTAISLNQEVVISGTMNEMEGYFSFTTENDGYYTFYSYNNGEVDPYCEIYDMNGNWYTDNDDGGEELNFAATFYYTAGETYYFYTYCYEIDGYGSYTIAVIPSPAANELKIDESLLGTVGGGESIDYMLLPYGCLSEYVTFESSDENVASVNDQGYVEYIGEGVATITATSENGLTDTCTVRVAQPQEIELGTTYTKEITEPYDFVSYTFEAEETGYYDICIKSEYEYIYRVSSQTNGTSGEYGHTMEGYYISDLSFKIEEPETFFVTVSFKDPAQTGAISVTPSKAIMATLMAVKSSGVGYVGDSYTLCCDFYPEGSYNESITWSADNDEVAYVSEWGEIELLSAGTVNVNAVSEFGLTATKTITVKDYDIIAVDEEKEISSDDGYRRVYKFVPDKDGHYKFYSYNYDEIDSKAYLYDSEMTVLACDDDSGEYNNFQITYKLTAGQTYYFEPQFYSSSDEGVFYTKIEKVNAVSKINITSYPNKMDYYEGQESFYYDGLALEFVYEDGTTKTWDNRDQYFDGYYIRIYEEYSEEGEYLYSVIEYATAEPATFSFNILENPVKKITLVKGTKRKYVENVNGYYTTVYDPETDTEKEVFIYYANTPYDAKIRIDYKDSTYEYAYVSDYVNGCEISWDSNQNEEPWVLGSNNITYVTYLGHTVVLPITVIKNPVASIEYVSGEITVLENVEGYWEESEDDRYFYYYYNIPEDLMIKVNFTDGTSETVPYGTSIEGYWFESESDQHENHWELGDDNYLNVSILGKTAKVPVSVIKSDVQKITVDKAPTKTYIYGDSEYGYMIEDDYYFYPTDLSGIEFTVYYTDGTSEQFDYNDLDYLYGEYILNGYVIGFDFGYGEAAQVGNTQVTINYKGASDTYNVTLAKSPVASLTIYQEPVKTEYKQGFMPDFIGTILLIEFTDGTSKMVEIMEDTIVNVANEYSSYYRRYIPADDLKIFIDTYYDENDNEAYRFSVLDVYADCDFITFIDEKIIDVELDNLSYTGEDMLVKVTYNDGTTDSLVLENIWYNDFDSMGCMGIANTENGLLEYYIEMTYDKNGEPEECYVWILGRDITVSLKACITGDVDGDGKVGTTDLANLKLYLAGANELDEDGLTAADIDCDGKVGTTDLAILKLTLAGAI